MLTLSVNVLLPPMDWSPIVYTPLVTVAALPERVPRMF